LGSIAMAAAVGTVSGHYIFKAPLEEYWTEENAKNAAIAAAAAEGGGSGGGAVTGAATGAGTAATATATDSKSS
jgi:hypothetical protein